MPGRVASGRQPSVGRWRFEMWSVSTSFVGVAALAIGGLVAVACAR